MKIENHILKNVKYIESPNYSSKFKDLKYIIMHFTGGTTLEGAVETFKNKKNKVSAHLIIDRDGTIIQMVPFNVIAWHAGKSKWKEYTYLNKYSIGIEFVNTGKLKEKNGIYKDYWGRVIDKKDVASVVTVNEPLIYWQSFTKIQIEKGLEITKLLIKEYNIKDILRHSDIAKGRKIDPGDVFPMKEFKDLLK